MKQRVKQVYEDIADSWDNVRNRQRFYFRFWFDGFNARWKKDKVLDIGCGNCKNLMMLERRDMDFHAMDFSRGMVRNAISTSGKEAKEVKFSVSDSEFLPYRNSSFDYALSIAVYHHLSGGWLNALFELGRVLKPGGLAFIAVWHRWQKRFLLKPKDLMVPWRTGGKVYERYYHLFSFGEFRRLLEDAGFEILMEGSEKGTGFRNRLMARNACFLVRKPEMQKVQQNTGKAKNKQERKKEDQNLKT